jgi:hypothetical protein
MAWTFLRDNEEAYAYTAVAAEELDGVSGDVERLTGRRPTSLREHLEARREHDES